MTLAEDLLLTAMSPYRHRPVPDGRRLEVALAAAELADLALAGRITLGQGIRVVDPTPVGHPCLNEVLAALGGELADRTPAGWLKSQTGHRCQRYASVLTVEGAIGCRSRRRPWLWLYPLAWAFLGSDGTAMVLDPNRSEVAIVKDKRRRSQALKRMRRAGRDTSAPVEDRVLAAIAHACGLRRSGPHDGDAARPKTARSEDFRRVWPSGSPEPLPESTIWLLAGDAQQAVHDALARQAAQRAAEATSHGSGSHGGRGHAGGGHGSGSHHGHHHGGHSGHSGHSGHGGFGGHGGHGGFGGHDGGGHDGGHGW